MTTMVYNITTDFGASNALGDGQKIAATCTIAIGTFDLKVTANLFTNPGDIGKYISVPTALDGTLALETTITAVGAFGGGEQHITLNNSAGFALSSSVQTLEWGHDDAPAFDAFNTQALIYQAANPNDLIQLDIPAGRYEFATITGASNLFANGIHNLLINGNDQSDTFLSNCQMPLTGGFVAASFGLYGVGILGGIPTSSRLETVSAGSTTVQLKNLSELTYWSSREYAWVSGIDLQGPGSEPQNWEFFELVHITNVANVGGVGVITFTPPLVNTYLSTWPNYDPGSAIARDQGGPATLFAIASTWNNVQVWQDLTIDQNIPVNCGCMDITFRNVTATGPYGLIMSGNGTITWDNVTIPDATLEVDKPIGTAIIMNSNLKALDFQSPSPQNMTITDTVFSNGLVGSPYNLTMSNVTAIFFRPGCHSYGASNSLTMTNCNITPTFDGTGGVKNPILTGTWTISNGLITIPLVGAGAIPWAVPGKHCLFDFAIGYDSPTFTILDVYGDGLTYTYVQTSLSISAWPDPSCNIYVHPAPICYASGCTGAAQLVDMNLAGAQGKPINSYALQTITQAGTVRTAYVWGKLGRVTINVQTAYVPGAAANPFLELCGHLSNYPVIMPDNSVGRWYQSIGSGAPKIDLKTAGIRTITSAGATSPVGANDIGLTPLDPEQVFPQDVLSIMSDSVADNPSFQMTVEWIMDQGFEEVDLGSANKVISYGAAKYTTRPTKIPHV